MNRRGSMSNGSPEFGIGQKVAHRELGEGVVLGLEPTGFLSRFSLRTITQMAVPTRMPSRFCSVEKTEGSGLPSGVSLPVSRLSPFMQSNQRRSNSARNLCRMTTKEGSLRYEKFDMNDTTPLPVISAMRRSARRKKRT
jgi:hypothetical protein